MKVIEIESETARVRTEQGKTLVKTPRRKKGVECIVICDEIDYYNSSSVPKVHKETPGRVPFWANLIYLRTRGSLRKELPYTDQ